MPWIPNRLSSHSSDFWTSSNAVNVVKSLNVKDVLFVPDTYLGNFVKSKLNEEVNIITYPGYCPTHLRIKPEDIINLKSKYKREIIIFQN